MVPREQVLITLVSPHQVYFVAYSTSNMYIIIKCLHTF